jgi:hypothetical protein
MRNKAFIEYVLSFYGPAGIYGRELIFGGGVSEEEVVAALKVRKKNKKVPFDGDSLDREIVRDIMLYLRGKKHDLEYSMKPYFRGAK